MRRHRRHLRVNCRQLRLRLDLKQVFSLISRLLSSLRLIKWRRCRMIEQLSSERAGKLITLILILKKRHRMVPLNNIWLQRFIKQLPVSWLQTMLILDQPLLAILVIHLLHKLLWLGDRALSQIVHRWVLPPIFRALAWEPPLLLYQYILMLASPLAVVVDLNVALKRLLLSKI